MALILRKAWETYWILFDDIADPRTKPWLLVAKPFQGLTILGLYLMFVLKWGPQCMKHRQPFNLDKLLIVYNAFQVFACMYMFVGSLVVAWGWKYRWICEPLDPSTSPNAMEVAGLVYFYFILKVIDLLDTVFFVLRKKNNQITFLHIYHHTGMVMLIWGAVTYLPGGHGTLIGVINSFVHIVMYSYYLLTVAVPSIKNAVWLKKHVTQLQIIQFFWCVVHMAIIVFKTDCKYPRWTAAVFLPQNLFMLILFIDFYIKTYILKPKRKKNDLNNGKINYNGVDNTENATNNTKKELSKLNNENKMTTNFNTSAKEFKKLISNNNDYNFNSNTYENNNSNAFAKGKNKINYHDRHE